MAQTTDSLVIDVSVNSNDVIKFFEVLSDKLNQLLGHAQQTGEKLDALGDSSDGINEVSSSLNEAGQNAKKTTPPRGNKNRCPNSIRRPDVYLPPSKVMPLHWPLCLVPNSCSQTL